MGIQTAIGEDLKSILGLDNELEYTKHESVKKMDVVRRAGNRGSFGSGYNNNLTVSGRGSSKNREDSGKGTVKGTDKGTDKGIIRTVSSGDVFSSEYKKRSFEYSRFYILWPVLKAVFLKLSEELEWR